MSAQGLMSSETMLFEKQGIVTILSSDCEKNRASSSSSSSLRRTLSADMSSKKWLSENGFFTPMMKKTVSSQKLSQSDAADSCSSSSDSESSYDCEERKKDQEEAETIWSEIQKDKNRESDDEKPGAFDIWSSIMKTNEDVSKSSLPPPYIHPLVKRSKSSLSQKSLEICTESLGSETGSDGFSSYPSSETGETEDDKDDDEEEETEKVTPHEEHHETEDDYVVPKFNYSATSKKYGPRSFPPPLPSLTRQDGPSVHMRSRRENGRLVLEAVSVPSQNNFCARRQDGRLLLTFNNLTNYEEEDEEEEYDVDVDEIEEEEVFDEYEKDDDEEQGEETEEDKIDKIETEQQAPIFSSIVNSVDRLGLSINKPIGFSNRNPRWSEKLNEVVVANSEDAKTTTVAAKSLLPPRPRAARSVVPASFNAYEYFWRGKSTNHNPQKEKHIVCEAINQAPCEQQKLMDLKGKNGDYWVHNWSSCKESRRSLLFWETRCIATSS